MSNKELGKRYDPSEIGKQAYKDWTEAGHFKADETSDKDPYCIVIPPPNVTGVLHLGHALDETLQDILIRHKRMAGYETLWQPGTDHAGIATQNVVEKELAKEGLTRDDLGREKFIERVWEQKEKSGGRIIEQLKALGCSCDWDRLRFTMDDGLSKAVREVFVSLYEEGLIYRRHYITNWCPRCQTALSDLEVEHDEKQGAIYEIEYPFADGSGSVIVATTRPETMLGDSAVAVNPSDERYEGMIGKKVILPLSGREIPIIGDSYVAMDFGTGALKITPAHDPNDFEIGRKHGLEEIIVIARDGTMTDVPEVYLGLSREDCRKKIVKDLDEQDFLKGIKEHTHAVGECYRCKTVIEPTLSVQWFVKTEPLAKEAIRVVEDGTVEFIPKTWENTYFEWMNNIRDWCISRQIWWGHRIPAWFCEECDGVTVARETPTACCHCGCEKLRQETDVLDTWFSSALWPFSTLGWPDKTKSVDKFYPNSTLVTGFDIIFFWVARMIMMGIKFTGKAPFSKIYIHALIRDEDGQKMSKSRGNVIDPMDIIEEYGADALRFTLCAGESQGRDARLSMKKIEGYRNFVNKLWNAARFALMHLEGVETVRPINELELEPSDRWILSRLQRTIADATAALEKFRFNDLASTLYHFTWNEFCDWYIEFSKERLYGDNKEVPQALLVHLLDNLLRLLHPVMPFVTEEIYQKLPVAAGSIMVAPFPIADENLMNKEAEAGMELAMELITALRNIRAELGLSPKQKLNVKIKCSAEDVNRFFVAEGAICQLGNLAGLEAAEDMQRPAKSATGVTSRAELYIPLEGLIDIEQELSRLQKEVAKIEKDIAFFDKKFANENFVKNAPKAVLEKDMAKNEKLKEKLSSLKESIGWLA